MRIIGIMLCVLSIGIAQERREDPPTNLKVLPDSLTGRQVREVMGEFTSALGVHCNYCHVSANERMDFASDAKPQKETARGMIRMMNDINNNHLAKLFSNDPDRIRVSCTTCHHGSTEPRKIEDVLWDTYAGSGADKAIDQYKDLRDKYYGSFTYDFREFPLIRLASKCEQQKKYDDAVKFLNLNLGYFPDSQYSKMTLASVYVGMDQKEKAKAILNDLLKAHPDDERAQRMLDRISK